MADARAAALAAAFPALSLAERLALLRSQTKGRIVFTTSLGLEDQVLTHVIAGQGLEIEIVTLDTGRLFPQAYALWSATQSRYGLSIRGFYPRHDALERYVAEAGIDGFYSSVEARKACCGVRKVEPLARALAGAEVWITGLRAEQSPSRGETPFVGVDAGFALIKANPLLDWTREQTAAFAAEHDVPVNPLHAEGFLSIGCAPCTRAVAPGEPERAGRWWWENEDKKECGLHVGPDGRLTRPVAAPDTVFEGAAS